MRVTWSFANQYWYLSGSTWVVLWLLFCRSSPSMFPVIWSTLKGPFRGVLSLRWKWTKSTLAVKLSVSAIIYPRWTATVTIRAIPFEILMAGGMEKIVDHHPHTPILFLFFLLPYSGRTWKFLFNLPFHPPLRISNGIALIHQIKKNCYLQHLFANGYIHCIYIFHFCHTFLLKCIRNTTGNCHQPATNGDKYIKQYTLTTHGS